MKSHHCDFTSTPVLYVLYQFKLALKNQFEHVCSTSAASKAQFCRLPTCLTYFIYLFSAVSETCANLNSCLYIQQLCTANELPGITTSLLDVLIQHLLVEHVDYALDLGLQSIPIAESKSPPKVINQILILYINTTVQYKMFAAFCVNFIKILISRVSNNQHILSWRILVVVVIVVSFVLLILYEGRAGRLSA